MLVGHYIYKYNIMNTKAEGITIKYSMINMDKILDAPTAIAPTDIIYGTQISNVYNIYIYTLKYPKFCKEQLS